MGGGQADRPVMFVVQPHFDDAVLGIGLTMFQHARSGGDGFTLTVFGGRPREYRPLSERPHDDRCGFSPTDDPVGVRRAEERAAWALLGDRWTGRWLPWLDAQYLWPEHHDPFDDAHDIAVEILAAWEKAGKPPTIWTVAGIAHEDHVLCRDAVLAVARAADVDVNVWLEPGYRTTFNSSEALASITRSTGPDWNWRYLTTNDVTEKLLFVETYLSQLGGLTARTIVDALVAEAWGEWSLSE
jgi:LmbE family N-acetylglucosaminyl deacetylase